MADGAPETPPNSINPPAPNVPPKDSIKEPQKDPPKESLKEQFAPAKALNWFFAATLIMWPVSLFLGLFLADDPTSSPLATRLDYGALLIYPVLVITSLIVSWVARKFSRPTLSFIFALIPLLPLVVFIYTSFIPRIDPNYDPSRPTFACSDGTSLVLAHDNNGISVYDLQGKTPEPAQGQEGVAYVGANEVVVNVPNIESKLLSCKDPSGQTVYDYFNAPLPSSTSPTSSTSTPFTAPTNTPPTSTASTKTSTGFVDGYILNAASGSPLFKSILLPPWQGQGPYDIYLWSGNSFVLYQTVAPGTQLAFPSSGISEFEILGIDPSWEICPGQRGFLMDISFTATGTFHGTQEEVLGSSTPQSVQRCSL